MAQTLYQDVTRRHDFVLLFDVTDGNPNGDPDAGNLPRVDPETMQGLVTDVAIKRKVRDWVDVARGTEERYAIYVQHGAFLTDTRTRTLTERGQREGRTPEANTARAWMCDAFFDVRMFGAVMSMSQANAGQVRGPVQLTFARSLDPIVPLDLSIVGPAQRPSDTRPADAEDSAQSYGTMGRKALVPYGLYRAHGFFNPHFAKQTGVTEEDLELFWQALQQMWDLDRSASRGLMACQRLYVFSHESSLGNAPAHRLFERVRISRRADVEAPRSFRDYSVEVDDTDLPSGVTLTRLVA